MIRSLLKILILVLFLIPGFFLWKRSKLLAVLYALGAIILFFSLVVRANSPSDTNLAAYDFLTRVDVRSTSALDNLWIPFEFYNTQLLSNGFISQADYDDILSVNTGSSFRELVGQLNSTTPPPTWWLKAEVGDVPADTDRQFELHTGNSTVTHDYPLGLLSTDSVTILDSASLDITTRLTVEALGVELDTIPSAETWLLNKDQAYGLGVRSGNEIFGYVLDPASSATETLTPNTSGDENPFDTVIGDGVGDCTAAGAGHFGCVNDPVGVPDDNTTRIADAAAGEVFESYNLTNTTISEHEVITSVTVNFRWTDAAVDGIQTCVRPALRLTAVNTNGTQLCVDDGAGYRDNSELLAKPGGGNWTVTDLNNLQVRVGMDSPGGAPVGHLTQIYVTVAYQPATEVSSATIAVDTEYDFAVLYDDNELELFSNGVRLDNANIAFVPVTNSENVAIGPFSGEVHNSRIYFGAATQLDETANNNDATNTDTTAIEGYFNSGVYFNGGTDADSMLQIPNSASIQDIFDGGGTIETWVFPFSDGEVNQGRILEKGPGWTLFVWNEGAGRVALYFDVDFTITDGEWGTTLQVVLNTWNHIAVVYNADAVANNPTFYINGVAVDVADVTEWSTPNGVRVSDGGTVLQIGNRTGLDRTFDGKIDDVRIWDDTRTPAEILANYQTELTGTEANLGAYYRFEDNLVLDLTYEPDTMEETDKGDAGDGWTWEGTITDQSTSANNGTYIYTRTYVNNLTGDIASVGSPEIKNLPVDPDVEDLVISLIGPFDFSENFTADPGAATTFPFEDIFTTSANAMGLPARMLWIAFWGILSYLAGLLVIKGSKQPGFGLGIMNLLILVGGAAALYPLYYVAIATACYFGLFAWSRIFTQGEM